MNVLINGETYSTEKNRIWVEVHGNREFRYGFLPFSAAIELDESELIKPHPVRIVIGRPLVCAEPENTGFAWRFLLDYPIHFSHTDLSGVVEIGIITAIHMVKKQTGATDEN